MRQRFGIRSMVLLTPSRSVSWGGTFLIVVFAYLLRAEVFTALPPLPLLFFLPAILFSAIFFGAWFGLFATAFSAVLAFLFFLPHIGSSQTAAANAGLSLSLFVLTGMLITLMGSALRNAYRHADRMQREMAEAYVLADRARAQAEAGERERELLLVEFGHRVKNDMQRTIATLHLRAAHSTPEVAAALRQAADQVNVVASMHDRLAHREGEVEVDMKEFLEDLVSGLRGSMAETLPINFIVNAEKHTLPLDRASAVGLIANELVTNALKHAFPADRPGTVVIDFKLEGGGFHLAVSDDGAGMRLTAESDPDVRRPGLGKKLVRALATQLGGTLVSQPRMPNGTTSVLTFPSHADGRADRNLTHASTALT